MTRSKTPSHYDTLGLKNDCSTQEIKDSFITLSKSFHPDKSPNDPNLNAKFIKINEAYSVLSKPHLRSTYDFSLMHNFNSKVVSSNPMWRDSSIWSMRNKEDDKYYENRPYYGIRGIKRVSNNWIAGGAVIIMLIGTIFHYAALKSSSTFTTNQLDFRDKRLGEELRKAQSKATQNGNELQLELLRTRLENENADEI